MIREILAAALVLSAAAAAQADTFKYAYVFGDGGTVTGSFSGTVSGDLVTGLSNISAAIDGVEFSGSGNLFGSSWNGTNLQSGGAVVSFSGKHNNFSFGDVDSSDVLDSSNFFYINNALDEPALAFNFNLFQIAGDPMGYKVGNWTLTNVSAVPEPESFALLLAGLGVMGAVVRRRKQEDMTA